MKNCFKLKLVAISVLLVSSVAQASIANVNDNVSVENPYPISVINLSPRVFAIPVIGKPNLFFEEFANFTIPTFSTISTSANTYSLNLENINFHKIIYLKMKLWDNTHSNGNTLFGSFLSNNTTIIIDDLTTDQYHLDTSGQLGSSTHNGQYSMALEPLPLPLPVPEPEKYNMLLAGFVLVGFSIRRRKMIA